MNWQIGYKYELVEKRGLVWELGKLIAIRPDGTLEFKKDHGCTHVHTLETGVIYRQIPIRTESEAAGDTRNTVLLS
jgi:hypothetical protein